MRWQYYVAAAVCSAIWIYFFWLPASPSASPNDDGSLSDIVQVQAIFRHGDRAAKAAFRDPHLAAHWQALGLEEGMLTALGRRQSHALGQSLKQRYPQLVQSIAAAHQRFVASPYPRTRDTARCVAAGMFDLLSSQLLPSSEPPLDAASDAALAELVELTGPAAEASSTYKLNVGLTLDAAIENKPLFTGFDLCPGLVDKRRVWWRSALFSSFEEQAAPLIARLTELTGDLQGQNTTLRNLYTLYDTVLTQKIHGRLGGAGHELVALVGSQWWWRLLVFYADFSTQGQFSSEVVGALAGSPLLQQILLELLPWAHAGEQRGARGGKGKTFVMWSGHDSTLMGVAAALQLDTAHPGFLRLPPVSTALVLELHRERRTEELYIQLQVRWGVDGEVSKGKFQRVALETGLWRACGTQPAGCPLSTFVDIVKEIMVPHSWQADTGQMAGEWCKQCRGKDGTESLYCTNPQWANEFQSKNQILEGKAA